MTAEREPRSSPSIPNPLGARIAALVCLALAVFALLLAVIGVLVLGAFERGFVDGLILMLGGAFFTVFFIILARGFHTMAKHDQRARRLAAGRCPRCGYDIHNLPEPRCPECGEIWSADEVGKRA